MQLSKKKKKAISGEFHITYNTRNFVSLLNCVKSFYVDVHITSSCHMSESKMSCAWKARVFGTLGLVNH